MGVESVPDRFGGQPEGPLSKRSLRLPQPVLAGAPGKVQVGYELASKLDGRYRNLDSPAISIKLLSVDSIEVSPGKLRLFFELCHPRKSFG